MRALVTGAGGFLGKAIARRLCAEGWEVRTFQRGDYPELEAWGCRSFRGDLADPRSPDPPTDGCDVVFHAAAKVGAWGRYSEFYRANVEGTRRVLEACRRSSTPRLVFTSSPSVVFDGRDQEGIDESAPYPRRYLAAYPRTKAAAERIVLAANRPDLATVSLRPHLIWGPGDRHLAPRIADRARRGRLRIAGSGSNRIDTTYIDNAVDAHLQAASKLAPGAPCAGKAYFISNGEPMPLVDWVRRILRAAHLETAIRSAPPGVAYAAALLTEAAYKLLRRDSQPPLTRFLVRELATAHWFDLSAARRELGYRPRISIDEGMRRLERRLSGQDDGP